MKVIANLENLNPEDCLQLIKLNCNIFDNLVAMKIYFNWHDNYYFDICELDELYYKINELIQDYDCKNGCKICEDDDGKYLSILGTSHYKDGSYVGEYEIKIQFKNFHW